MAPLVRPGDQVLISRIVSEQIRLGDIVLFRRDGDMIVHRVLKKHRSDKGIGFSEKGDNTLTCGLIDADKIIGRVTMVKGGRKMLGFGSPVDRLTNLTLSVWFYWTTATVAILRASTSKNIRRVGKGLSYLVLLSSNVLVRICCVVWYLSALVTTRRSESGLSTDVAVRRD